MHAKPPLKVNTGEKRKEINQFLLLDHLPKS